MGKIAWNEKRRDRIEWAMVERVVGVPADGIVSQHDVDAVQEWQADKGLTADGLVGKRTLRVVKAFAQPLPAVRRLGVYYDLPTTWTMRHLSKVCEQMAVMGFDYVVVELDESTPTTLPDWQWSPQRLERFGAIARAAGLELEVSSWPRPDPEHLEASLIGVVERILALGAHTYDLDLEGNWEINDVDGFPTLQAAGEWYVEALRESLPDVKLCVTTFPNHGEHIPSRASVAPLVDALRPQAYSFASTKRRHQGWGDYLGPGNMQRYTYDAARDVTPPGYTLDSLALAGYAQAGFQGHTADEAMSVALEAALSLGCDDICYWSAKWLLDNPFFSSKSAQMFVPTIKRRWGRRGC